MTLYIHAPNVHQGGGKTLLSALLEEVSAPTHCILDERMQIDHLSPGVLVRAVKPTLLKRFQTEWWLSKVASVEDTIICFGNLPPFFKSRARVFVFLQNRYLFGDHVFSKFSFAASLRLRVERFWFKTRMRHGYQIIVQSQTMQHELKACTGFNSLVKPFIPKNKIRGAQVSRPSQAHRQFDFVYVSSGEPHKNHARLLDAWVLLAQQNIRPSLALTLSVERSQHLVKWIEATSQAHGLKLTNLGGLTHGEVQKLYKNSGALIFPSKLESFGLPLLEADQVGLPILAPELDYVRDVVVPTQTFDPNSAVSIARAVLRHLEQPMQKMAFLNASEFLAFVQGHADS